jgi:rubredoxin
MAAGVYGSAQGSEGGSMSAEFPWTFIHPACGRPAFHRVSVPFPTDPITAQAVQHLDGSPVYPNEIFRCESCGHVFGNPPKDFAELTDQANWRRRTE